MIDLVALLAVGCRSGLRVGIGLSGSTLESTAEKLKTSGCSVDLVGFKSPNELAASLRSGSIDAAVRGTLSSAEVLSEIKSRFRIRAVERVAVIESKKPFLLAPVGIDEGMDASSRLRMAENALRYFGSVGWQLRVGVLSKGRQEDGTRGADIQKSIHEGDEIASALSGEGCDAKHYAILVEDAVRDCDMVLAPDGVSGNLMFRTLHFVGGAKAFGAPIVNLDRIFVDTSRAKQDFSEPVMLAAALAEHGHVARQRA